MGSKQSTDNAYNENNNNNNNNNKRNSSVANVRRPGKPEHEFLTDEQEVALQESWQLIKKKDLQLVGINLLLRIFEIEPATRETFKMFKGLNHDQLLKNPLFKSHAIRFMKAVEVTIENLHALDVIIIPNLKHLGRRHTKIESFKICHLKVVEQAFDEVWSRIHNGEDISVPGFEDRFPIQLPAKKQKAMHGSNNSLSRSVNSLKKYKNKNETTPNTNSTTTQNVAKKSSIKKTVDYYDRDTKEAWVQTVSLITSKITEGYVERMEIIKVEKEKSSKELEDKVEKLKVDKEEKNETKLQEEEETKQQASIKLKQQTEKTNHSPQQHSDVDFIPERV